MLDLATALRADGIDVEIACPERGILAERGRLAGVPIFAVEKGRGLDIAAARRMSERLRTGKIDLIHSHNGRTIFIAALAATLARRGHTVATQHFTRPARLQRQGFRGWLSRRVHQALAGRTDHIVAISEIVRKGILERGEVGPEKVTMVWNGIADPSMEPLRPATEIRAEFHVPAGAPLIVSAARLEPEKSVHLLIEAFGKLRSTHPRAHCLIAGEGRQRAELQALIDRLGIADSLRLIGYQPDVLSIVGAANLFALPSPEEPFGLALVEAMALGRPVIAMRAGGPLEIVRDGESGLLVAPENAEELCAAMSLVLTDHTLANDLRHRARQRFLSCFTAQRMARDMARIYSKTTRSGVAINVGQSRTSECARSLTGTSGQSL